jgi:tRNA dimethylallyltransferase
MKKNCLLILGPTAVGKTSLSIRIAELLHTDIISADSRQCYRELNIGVAKPENTELEKVKHYFINSHCVMELVNAADFENYALTAVSKIFEDHSTAVMVGGTGLYINAFCEGLDQIPPVSNKIRNSIINNYEANGIEWLQEKLLTNDPLYASKGEMKNPQRMMRALEVIESTGHSILHFQQKQKKTRPFHITKIGLELPREILYDRINQRVDQMMSAGLLEEVFQLQKYKSLNALQTVGYRELFDYFDNKQSLETAINAIKQNSRHYAKRQMTWFKKDESIIWMNPNDKNIVEKILNKLGNNSA